MRTEAVLAICLTSNLKFFGLLFLDAVQILLQRPCRFTKDCHMQAAMLTNTIIRSARDISINFESEHNALTDARLYRAYFLKFVQRKCSVNTVERVRN
jgi:hypothetical protein